MSSFPNNRDFFYIVGFLSIAIIFIITGRLSDNINVVNYIGFAGTIVSMLLAVIAIIYSFYQSSTYANSTQKLDMTANKIEEITEELSEVAEIGGNISYLKEMVDKISDIVTNIETNLNLYEEIDKKPSSMGMDNVTSSSVKVDNANDFDYDKEYFEKVVSNLTVLAAILIVWIQKCYKLNVNFNIKDCSRFFVEDIMMEKNKYRLSEIENAISGLLIAYEHLDFFELTTTIKGEFKVNTYNEKLSTVLEEGKTDISLLQEHFDRIEKILKSEI